MPSGGSLRSVLSMRVGSRVMNTHSPWTVQNLNSTDGLSRAWNKKEIICRVTFSHCCWRIFPIRWMSCLLQNTRVSLTLSNLLSPPSLMTRRKRKVPSLQAQANTIQLCTLCRLHAQHKDRIQKLNNSSNEFKTIQSSDLRFCFFGCGSFPNHKKLANKRIFEVFLLTKKRYSSTVNKS